MKKIDITKLSKCGPSASKIKEQSAAAICTDSVGTKDENPEKWESCFRQVKKDVKPKKESSSTFEDEVKLILASKK